MKKFICYLLTILAVCTFSFYNAACADSADLDILTLEEQTLTETMLPKGIKKKVNVMRFVYTYGGDFSKSNYNYKTVREEVTFFDTNNHNRVIAVVCMESHFRYNTKLNEAKCLSTSHCQACNNSEFELTVFARSKNLSYELGESFDSVTLTKKGMFPKQIDKSDTAFKCDAPGNVVHRIYSI
ncbi:MAG: hypothetical protein LBR79_01690 [Oscillospiraceae bacterium]|jgi:hypothetical protein|nr:hypothetical protein [Oscillospiraceae bacterium]